MVASLQADVDKINEMKVSVDETSMSMLVRDCDEVHFSITSSSLGKCDFILTVAEYPGPGLLVCTNNDDVGLEKINGKITSRCTLGTVLTLLGYQLGVDLEFAAQVTDEASDDGNSYDSHDESDRDASDDDDEIIREWSRRSVQLERIEKAAAEQDSAQIDEDGCFILDALSKRQIFDQSTAFRRLANELEEIFRSQDFDLVADADSPQGLYMWDVHVANFRHDSALAADMHAAGRAFGASSVHFQLTFKRGLHPFYPPAVRIVSPRMQPGILVGIEGHPILKLSSWDPTMSAKELVLEMKKFLEDNARVDLESLRNREPGTLAYLEVEHLLSRLQALSGFSPPSQFIYRPLASLQNMNYNIAPAAELPASKKMKSSASPDTSDSRHAKAAAWKEGTGYGFKDKDDKTVWDAKRAEAVQAARDAEVCAVLKSLSEQLQRCLSLPSSHVDYIDAINAISSSCLQSLLIKEFSTASFYDMCGRATYYNALLDCVQALSSNNAANILLGQIDEGSKTIASVLTSARTQAEYFQIVCSQADNAAASSSKPAPSTPGRHRKMNVGASKPEDDRADLELAKHIVETAASLASVALPATFANLSPSSAAAAAVNGEQIHPTDRQHVADDADAQQAGGEASDGEDARYLAVMQKFRVAIIPGIATNHKYNSAASRESCAPSKQRARRVGKELASLESDLPVAASSSIFVIADEANSVLWKALITGPKNTPYDAGCFLFDIYFDPEYPKNPPKVSLRTTGGGAVRFNPNLYAEGKVCLSLLGTWSGSRGESWDENFSTILQVLVSIQSLILVDEPFYNEPGYGRETNTKRSNAYSAEIMEQTVRWAMLDQLRSPPRYFDDCIRAHFRERAAHVLATVERWAAWCKDVGHADRSRNIMRMLPELKVELQKLRNTAA